MPTLDTFITGLHFRPAEAKALAARLEIGDPVTLLREPDNQWDSEAIMVYAQDDALMEIHIGYIPAAHNSQLALYMDQHGNANVIAKIAAGGPGRPGLSVTYGE